jgi:PhnB protein
MAKSSRGVPEGYHTITPTLALDNAAQSIEFYKKAFGATEIGRSAGPDGKIMHAEIQIGNSRVMVNDVMMGMKGPQGFGGSPAGLWLYVDDSDALFKRAVDAGAKVVMPLDDQFWGDRGGCVTDPDGYKWWIATRKEDLAEPELKQRAEEFFRKMSQPT